jgi:hypothetical protein
MAVEFGIWRVDGSPVAVAPSKLDDESRLENWLTEDISILGLDVLVIGRQQLTASGGKFDLLAIDRDGELHLFELKRDKTPREVVAQVLDYASWVAELGYDEISRIFEEHTSGKRRLEEAFEERFGVPPPEALNQAHHLAVVASELDASTERIVTYLASQGVAINVLFFRYFVLDGHQYLGRTFLLDPGEADASGSSSRATRKSKEPWNGQDFYVSLGEDERRTWDDCRRYGYVSGGGKPWFSNSLKQLAPGARVFVNIPGTGYVGVGPVTETVVPVTEFRVDVDGAEIPILEADHKAPGMDEHADDPERAEYMVRVEWIATRDKADAIWKKGMFANQNTACKLRNRFTLEELTQAFELDA